MVYLWYKYHVKITMKSWCNPRKKIYICSCFHERDLADLYINELSDHYNVKDLKVTKNFIQPDELEDMTSKILRYIKDANIVIAFIENTTHSYAETLSEIGMAIALNKPIVIFDSSKEHQEPQEEGDIPNIIVKGNRSIIAMPIYSAKTVIITSKWSETRLALKKIVKFMNIIENQSDSD